MEAVKVLAVCTVLYLHASPTKSTEAVTISEVNGAPMHNNNNK